MGRGVLSQQGASNGFNRALQFASRDELANHSSTSRGVEESSELAGDVLVGEGRLLFNVLNIGRLGMVWDRLNVGSQLSVVPYVSHGVLGGGEAG